MTIELKLDSSAMNALFPEGSEARLNLQRAVIANFTRNMLTKYVSAEVQREVRIVADQMKGAIGELVRKEFEVNWSGSLGNMRQGSQIAEAIKLRAASEFQSLTAETTRRVFETMAADAKLEQRVKEQVERYISAGALNVVRQKVDAAMAALR